LKLAGCLLLFSGVLLVIAALTLLPGFAVRCAFVGAGLVVEAVGLGVLAQGHKTTERAAVRAGAGTHVRSSQVGSYR